MICDHSDNLLPLIGFLLPTQHKSSADFVIDYCGLMQKIKEQCGQMFTVVIYFKIFEDNKLNNVNKYLTIFFTDICTKNFKVKSEIIFSII